MITSETVATQGTATREPSFSQRGDFKFSGAMASVEHPDGAHAVQETHMAGGMDARCALTSMHAIDSFFPSEMRSSWAEASFFPFNRIN